MRKQMAPILLLCLWIGSTPGLGAAADPQDTLAQAVAAYMQAQEATLRDERLAGFRQAQRLFEHAAGQGVRSADLYANLGNAALQAERLGPAILAYRRALELDPNHARASQNLRHARTLLPAWVPRPGPEGALESFFFWRNLLSPAEQAGIAALAFLLGALLLAAAIRWRSPLARTLAVLPLLAWLGLLISAAIETRGGGKDAAVIVADETVGRGADSHNARARFAEPLPGGTEVRVRETREHWVHIVLADGRDAWVARAAVATLERHP